MKIKLLSSVLLAASILMLSVNANAGHHSKNDRQHSQSDKRGSVVNIMKKISKLDLTDEQNMEIKAIVQSGLDDSKDKRQAMRALKSNMKTLRHTEVLDEQAIKLLSAEMADIKSDLMIMHINKRRQVAALLTDEQKETFKEMKHKRRSRH
jgi:Spy/CpxP family protein refolding chaperone